jgi:dolichol-phosphate mannosyltransferase
LVTAGACRALPLLRAVAAAHPDLRFELVVVDDGPVNDGPDDAGPEPGPVEPGEAVRVVTLARRFGPYAVLCAGLATARGEVVVVLDPTPPSAPDVVAAVLVGWRDGHDVVWAASPARGLRDRLPGVPVTPGERRPSMLVTRPVLDAVHALPRRPRDVVATIARIGTRQTTVSLPAPQAPAPRRRDRAVRALSWLAGLYSAPFLLLLLVGLLVAGAGVAVGLGTAAVALVAKTKAWSLVVATILVVGGLNLAALGGFGEYLWRTGGGRDRPGYVIAGVRDA